MYTVRNFKTKKALVEAVRAYQAWQQALSEHGQNTGEAALHCKPAEPVRCYNPGPFGQCPENGRVSVEGPHYPEPHRWYASVVLENGIVVSVK